MDADVAANAPVSGHRAATQDLFSAAHAAHERGSFAEAESGYRVVLADSPDHAQAWHGLGVLQFQQSRAEEADASLKRAIDLAPTALALANRASVLTSLGRRDEALNCLTEAVTLNPAHLRALAQRASLLEEMTRFDEALAAWDHVLKVAPTLVDALCRHGAVALTLGRAPEALASFERARAVQPASLEVLGYCADVLRQMGRSEAALDHCERALAISPGNARLLFLRGMTLADLGRLPEALAGLNESIAWQPDYIDALYNSSVVLERLRRYDEATVRCERVLALQPDHAKALANRGNAQQKLLQFDAALASYDAALQIEPDSIETLCNRTRVLCQLRRIEDALQSSERALALDSEYGPAWSSYAIVLHRLLRYEDSLVAHDRAVALAPRERMVVFQRGNTLRVMKRHREALEAFERVLEIDPDDVDTHFSQAFVYLITGDFARGWPEYEWRWREPQVGSQKRDFAHPTWDGTQSLAGQRILLHAEQGFGDTMQFCRYAPLVKALGAHVILEVQPALKSLLRGLDGVDELVAQGDVLPIFDLHCPLLSLPRAFHTELDAIPSGPPYLQADPVLVDKWRARLGTASRPRVGIVWAGNPKHLDDHNRSIALEQLRPVLTDAYEWISLQKPLSDDDRAVLDSLGVAYFGDEVRDFSDTAALIELTDLVLSVDTSVAHLAGALGKPCWVLLPHWPDWRWLFDRDDSPWYPRMRLFRQPGPGDWSNVLPRVSEALRSVVSTNVSPHG
ncbi:Beta-barrel assembly-enhancing protease [Paraburkholderia sediminicola]|uniref:Beta-barrel assembly-enhancing protease n=1 Tax=Paraburkholderia sediminicola TaxID=458836 RepID=A0A6J4ZX02_9BURK|nr:tetratricopeptide repeat protein [Paraburkholderia sediminicola]CAB3643707.1 Beta-barrel assembly-enhancing protease [Paraburkholderia sediminicola]